MPPSTASSSPPTADRAPPGWLSPALTGGTMLLWIAGIVLQHALKPWPSQDDASQHIVWFRQYMSGAPLPASEIADYFIGSNGALFVALYRGIAQAGIDPIAAAWVVGLASALAAALAIGRTVAALGGSGWAAAVAPALMLVYLQGFDDIHSGTARAIGWGLLGMALWTLARDRALGFAAVLAVAAFVYPTVVALALAIAGLWLALRLWQDRDWHVAARWLPAGLFPALLLLYALSGADPWGPTISYAEARTLPDFAAGGRTPLFGGGWLDRWLVGNRLGLFPDKVRTLALMHGAALAAVLTGLVGGRMGRFLCTALAATVMLWLAAQLTLFSLYLPARFPTYGFAMVSVLAAALLFGRLLESGRPRAAALGGVLLIGSIAVIGGDWPDAELKGVHSPRLIAAVDAASPGRAAGLSSDIDRLPILSWRDVYWGREFSQGYKNRYRDMMLARSRALVAAIVSERPEAVAQFLAANGIGLVMMPADLWRPADQNWVRGLYPAERAKLAAPGAEARSWLWNQRRCMTQGERDRLYDAGCLIRAARAGR